MKQVKLTVDFKTITNGAFENKCTLILSSLTGNKYFPKPAPSLKELEAAMKKFSAASALATDGSKMDRQARDQQREIVVAQLIELKAYVEYEAKGDILKLTSSGFTVAGQKGKNAQTSEVKKFSIKQGKISGTIKGSFTDISWATSYGYEYTPTPIVDASWKTVPGGTCRFELTGLQRGVEYAVRICVKGAKGKMLYSPVLTILVV